MVTSIDRLAAIDTETPSSALVRQPWTPSLDEIAARLLEHLYWSGRCGMRPTDIAKDCRFLLEVAIAARAKLSDEMVDEIATGTEKVLMSGATDSWRPVLRALVRGAYSRGYQFAKAEKP